ncbi:MAG: hypothetical protein EOP84_16795 [Verrucomicrobiaceae bacterium]|nr:MAG: hypothetical protein EOP84_16795 [Verrucomicrobiaceae bacterium]
MEMTLAEHVFRAFALAGVLALVLILGWNEPLKYRFMSRAEIYSLENPQQVTDDKSWMWEKKGRRLEQGAYNRARSGNYSGSSLR